MPFFLIFHCFGATQNLLPGILLVLNSGITLGCAQETILGCRRENLGQPCSRLLYNLYSPQSTHLIKTSLLGYAAPSGSPKLGTHSLAMKDAGGNIQEQIGDAFDACCVTLGQR